MRGPELGGYMRLFKFSILFLILSAPIWAEGIEEGHHHAPRPDSHAPIGVMGDHRHKEGEWMVSYRFKTMRMSGSLNGSSRVSDQQILQAFPVTPTDMTMNAHMFGLMYAPSDDVTLMFTAPYLDKSMGHITRAGSQFTTNSSGFGDFKAGALVNLWGHGDT